MAGGNCPTCGAALVYLGQGRWLCPDCSDPDKDFQFTPDSFTVRIRDPQGEIVCVITGDRRWLDEPPEKRHEDTEFLASLVGMVAEAIVDGRSEVESVQG